MNTRIAIVLTAVCAGAACGGPKRTIRIPESVIANPKKSNGKKESAVEPYVIKMSDGKRTWQIEIPAHEGNGTFQAVVPLDLGEVVAGPPAGSGETEADRQIKQDAPPQNGEGAPAASPGATPVAEEKGGKSYLATLARVNALFRKRQYEIALIELVDLERDYPDDERLLEMKGTLYLKLKKPKLAREAWERVLALNPDNTIVAQALEHLIGE